MDLYAHEVDDLSKIAGRLTKAVQEVDTVSLYINSLEAKVKHDADDVVVATLWWDSETEQMKITPHEAEA